MNSIIKKVAALLMACALALPLAWAGQAGAAAAVTVPDGEYAVEFKVLKDNSEETSVANGYIEPGSGKLIVSNGTMTFVSTFNNYDWFHYWGYLTPGKTKSSSPDDYTPSQVISAEDAVVAGRGATGAEKLVENYYGTVSMPVSDITKKLEILMHIKIEDLYLAGTPFLYDYWYNAQIWIDTSGLPLVPVGGGGGEVVQEASLEQLNQQISVAQTTYDTTTEGYLEGQYVPGSKISLHSAIVSARETANDSGATAEQITEAYNALVAALANYERLKIEINREGLGRLIGEATAYSDSIIVAGTATGTSGSKLVVSEGETFSSAANALKTALTSANNVYANASATQYQVDIAYATLSDRLVNAKKFKAIKETVRMAVLDSVPATDVSALSPYFSDTADLLRMDYLVYEQFTWKKASRIDKSSISYYRPLSNGEFGFSTSKYSPLEVPGDYEDDTWRTQITENGNGGVYNTSGLVYMTFATNEDPSVLHSVYLSFNVDRLNALAAKANEAQALLDGSSEGTGAGQHSADDRAALQAAIDSAKAVADNLGSTRLEISAASAALQSAVDAFQANQARSVYFSAVHAANATFSAMDSYLLKPAVFSTVNGATYANLTIKDSSIIPSFKVKQNGEYEDATVVSSNEEADTRAVTFKVENPGALVDAQVVIAQGSYQATHDIRLNFNNIDNTLLSQEVLAGTAALRTAQAGTAPGQYPAEAIAAYKAAIDAAGAEAIKLNGTQEQTDAMLGALQKAKAAFRASVVGEPNPGTEPGPGTEEPGTEEPGTEEPGTGNPNPNPDTGTPPIPIPIPGNATGDSESENGTDAGTETDPGTGGGATQPAVTFSDTGGHWAEASIAKAVELGIAQGFEDGTFRPNGVVTRAEIAVFLSRALKLSAESSTTGLSDLGRIPAWAREHVANVAGAGLMKGYADGTFGANDTITRAEIAVIVARALNLTPVENPEFGFADADRIPAWAKGEVAAAVEAGLMQGKDNNLFDPKASLTRAEALTLIIRVLEALVQA